MAARFVRADWGNPRLLDTPAKLRQVRRIDKRYGWQLGDHCQYRFFRAPPKMRARK